MTTRSGQGRSPGDVVIRPAPDGDLDAIIAIETSAGQCFHDIGLPEVAEDPPERGPVRSAIDEGRAWVAEIRGARVAYIVAEVLDGNAHIAQVSVAADFARRAVGRALMEHLEAWGRDRGCAATTLTTFRDVPWNAAYYARLGYAVLPPSEAGPDLRGVLDSEAALPALATAPRCAMIKHNGSRTPRP